MTFWLNARELAGLPGMAGTERRTRDRLMALKIPQRFRAGRGGGCEYDCSALPEQTRKALALKQIAEASAELAAEAQLPLELCAPAVSVASHSREPAPTRSPPSQQQCACADARLTLVERVLGLGRMSGTTKACQLLAQQIAGSDCSPEMRKIAQIANQRARTARVSERTLYRWLAVYQQKGWWGLLPSASPQKRATELEVDVVAVLALYNSRDPRFRALTSAAKHVTRQSSRDFDSWTALYARARRALTKIDNIGLIRSRHSGSERASRLPFKRRDTSTLKPLDVCLIDGHTFKAKVRHPDHGAPFAPEVTLVIDAASRLIVGWSASLSENTIAVGDALRHAVGNVGVFAIVYSDNGAGERAKVFDCPVDGIIKRMGGEHRTGIPGHPQGHGLIERSWRTHMIEVARRFSSYQGSDADSGSLRKVSALLAKEQRALRRADGSGEVIALSNKAPTWKQFIDAVDAGIVEYNNQHRHRSLPRRNDGKRMTPAEAWHSMFDPEQQLRMDPLELRMTFMPSVLRTAQRGEVVLFNQHYQAPELMEMRVDGRQVSVRYDIHDPNYVMVYTTGGEFVCEAKWNANRIDYFPKAVIEIAREKRVRATIKRREQQIDLARRELAGSAEPRSLPELDSRPATAPLAEEPNEGAHRPFFDTASARYEWLMARRFEWNGDDAAWVQD